MFILAQKQCSKCRKEKPFTQFAKNKTTSDGWSAWCKQCHNEYKAKYRVDNPEKVYLSNSKWKAANREKVYEKNRRLRIANREKELARTRRWNKNNLDKKRELNRKRRAIQNGNGGKITSTEEKWLFEFYDYTCLCCGRREPEIKLTLDHVKSIKDGGRNTIENAQPLCGSCNSSKGARHIDYRKAQEMI
jgi:5-methylcytosine-specific restriction endonuclease McrA